MYVDDVSSIQIENAEISNRAKEMLLKHNIKTLGNLMNYSKFEIRFLLDNEWGWNSKEELFSTIKKKYGLVLKKY